VSQKIWVIEQGDYSDYRVVGVYSTRENAELALTMTGGDISEWKMDPGIEEARAGFSRWAVAMRRNGDTVEVSSVGGIEESSDVEPCQPYEPGRFAKAYVPGERRIRPVVWARDAQHAVKIVNEYRTRLIAEGKWEEQ
jgi:hypothetical protein